LSSCDIFPTSSEVWCSTENYN